MDALRDYLNVFDKRDITNDHELGELVGQAKKLMRGVHVEQVKNDDVLRGTLEVQFANIKTQLDGMVSLAPTRAIFFGEE